MGEPEALIGMPFADGSVGYLVPKKIKHYDVPDQPLGWRGTIEYPPLFEPMEEEREKKEEEEEEERREKERKKKKRKTRMRRKEEKKTEKGLTQKFSW